MCLDIGSMGMLEGYNVDCCGYTGNLLIISALFQSQWWLFRQRVDKHTLNTLKHSERILISIDMLTPWVAVYQVLYIRVVCG